MGRRHRHKPPKPPKADLFDAAFENIDKLEQAVFYRTVTRDFTVGDVARAFWPAHIVQALSVAFQFIKESDCTDVGETLVVAETGRWSTIILDFMLQVRECGMCAPRQGLLQIQDTPKTEAVLGAIRETAAIHHEFQVVRDVVKWLNEHANASAAKYYMPCLGALLPSTHPFHYRDGNKFLHNISEIAPKMREATTIVAKGLLASPEHVHNEARSFRIEIKHNDNTESKSFFLI